MSTGKKIFRFPVTETGSRGVVNSEGTDVISAIVFFLTENMLLKMVLVDGWTILVAILFIAEAVLLILALTNKKRTGPQEGDGPERNAAKDFQSKFLINRKNLFSFYVITREIVVIYKGCLASGKSKICGSGWLKREWEAKQVKTRKVFAMALAALMLLSLPVTAYAEGEGIAGRRYGKGTR